MERRRIVFIAALLAVLAAILPLVGIAVYSRHRAMDGERMHLREYAGWTLDRTTRNLDMAKAALTSIEREHWSGCTTAQIDRMRQVSINTASVEEIGYFENGRLACTVWGKVDKTILVEPPQVQLGDGYAFDLGIKPRVTGGKPMNVLRFGRYNALMNPAMLVDVLTDTKMTLGVVAPDGHLLALSGPISSGLLDRLEHKAGFGRDGDQLYASVERGGLRAFAVTSYAVVENRTSGEMWTLVPLGVAVSIVLVGLILWASRLRLSPQTELAIAIRKREFTVCYQPMIDLHSGVCVGGEALVRWRRLDGSLTSPDYFIALAEETGLIDPLTDLVIGQVVADLGDLLRTDRGAHVAINISAADMQSGRFLPVLSRALGAAGIAPSQVWLEATERGFMNAEAARATIERARAAGHKVAIDDFGTGFSSLSLLETLPLDALKIDKSFIDAIGTEAATSVVVPHVIEMARELAFDVVAEGVETRIQEDYLRAAGVTYVQGWRYAKALNVYDFKAFFETMNGRRKAAP
ncbi:EAL domain-containing protein [Novosphingobium sp. 9]|uniref:EAL domain-containing protein n=1 Tax=Novosphingobium sp. 9 TaxID=2025349 RepID=UPI0021B4F1CD|nr:EAL domain-containing protein [Novosphingobium sp. 9]